MPFIKKHPMITGTILLTVTGLISRVIGFFYRIYLARLFGEEGMGVYQLLSPVLALSFSITAAAYQTAISKLVAASCARAKKASFLPMLAGLSISLPLSLIVNGVIYCYADFIGVNLLGEARCVPMLRILSFSIPFAAVHACINGYFYGQKKTVIPAVSQLAEQLTRVLCVYCVSLRAAQKGAALSINIAVLGLTVGEAISMLLAVCAVYTCYFKEHRTFSQPSARLQLFPLYKELLGLALPLTANRIVLNLLQSMESVSIPARLRLYGYSAQEALSVYGVLTGMAMPLIFFPNALTGSVAVLLLPMIAENHAAGDHRAVRKAILRTVKYCLSLGIVCMVFFVAFGRRLGNVLFDSALSGHFIMTLGFICPFIYLDITLSSILQGLGMAGRIFLMNAVCLLLRLGFILILVPHYGISGYLWGLLSSQLLLCLFYLYSLYRYLLHTRDCKS